MERLSRILGTACLACLVGCARVPPPMVVFSPPPPPPPITDTGLRVGEPRALAPADGAVDEARAASGVVARTPIDRGRSLSLWVDPASARLGAAVHGADGRPHGEWFFLSPAGVDVLERVGVLPVDDEHWIVSFVGRDDGGAVTWSVEIGAASAPTLECLAAMAEDEARTLGRRDGVDTIPSRSEALDACGPRATTPPPTARAGW